MIVPIIFKDYPEICAAVSTKKDIDNSMNLQKNIEKRCSNSLKGIDTLEYHKYFLSKMNISSQQIAKPIQCHSNKAVKVSQPGSYINCDALITDVKDITLIVSAADCVPIMLYDPVCKVIGIIHAGWRGSVDKITELTIKKIVSEYNVNPANLLAFIGPSASNCCYEVGDEIVGKFENKVVIYKSNKAYIDLKKINKLQLCQQGVKERNIEICALCTICEEDLFHSFRREGERAGRMLAVICIK